MILISTHEDKEIRITTLSGKVIILTVEEASELLHSMKIRDAIVACIHKIRSSQ